MGGANGAAPVDTSTIFINPAGLGHLGNTADFGAHVLIPDRLLDRTNATGPLVNRAGGAEESGQDVYVTPFSGMSWRPESSPWALGMTICGLSGLGATYDQPRVDPTQLFEPDGITPISTTGDVYDTSNFIMVLKAIPAASYDVTDQLSVGAGLHVDIALFSSDMAIATPGGLVPTAGRGRLEVSYLMGLQLGALYKINPCWSAGIAYTSQQWSLDDFGHYEDLIPGLELPPEIRCGVACQATPWLRLTTDYKYINWEQIAHPIGRNFCQRSVSCHLREPSWWGHRSEDQPASFAGGKRGWYL
jgi:long-subunit fatty acid transport protein